MGLGDLYQPGEREAEEQFDPQGHTGLKKQSGQTPEELAAYNAAERRRKQTGFKRDTDPTNREELMRNLAGREGSPSMQGAQAAGTTVGGAAQVTPTGQIQAGQLTGAGIDTLGGMAGGDVSRGLLGAEERAQRSILAMQAGARGSQNVGLVARGAQVAGEQTRRDALNAASEREFEAAKTEAALKLQEQGMTQEASIAQVQLDQDRAMQNAQFDQETTVLQAQLQQQLNLSNAEFQQRADEINLQVESQLAIERDKRMNELMRMGVDEEIARMKAEEEAWKFKSELMFNYWNAALQDELTRDVTMKQEEGMFDDDIELRSGRGGGGGSAGGGGGGGSTSTTGTANEAGRRADVREKFEADYGEDFGQPIGEMFEQDYGTKSSYDPSMEGPRDIRGAEVEEQMMDASATYDRQADAASKVQQSWDIVGKARRWGGAAFDILSGDEEQAKAGIAKLGRSELEGAATKKLAESGMGKWAGPAVAAGGAIADVVMDDSKELSTGDKLGYGLRKAAASSGGAVGGAALGGLGGGLIGGLIGGPPGAVVGTGIGSEIGGTLGAMGTSAVDEELFGSPTPRTILPGNMVASKMSVDPSRIQEDPLSISGPGKVDIGEDFEMFSPGEITSAEARRAGPRGRDETWHVPYAIPETTGHLTENEARRATGNEAWHTEYQPPHSAQRGTGYDTELGTPITASQRIDQLEAFLTRLANKESWEYGDQ